MATSTELEKRRFRRNGKQHVHNAERGIATRLAEESDAVTGEEVEAVESAEASAGVKNVSIPPPNIARAKFTIIGTAPYVQCRFSQKAQDMMRDKQASGQRAKKGGAAAARDFDADYEGAKHISSEGWLGIPCSSIRAALISACRKVGQKMTIAKISLFVEGAGLDKADGLPLFRIVGTPEKSEMYVRLATGVASISVRPMWREWSADVTIRYDANMYSINDVANLLMNAGEFVGIGCGRPDSRESAGMGFGTFRIKSQSEEQA